MVHCVSPSCREELDQKWNFCPFCGTDNRPPEYRPKIRNCRHEFIKAEGYCVDCGRKYGIAGAGMPVGPLRFRLGLASIAVGLVTFAAAFLIFKVHMQGHGPGYDWIKSWYDESYVARGKYGAGYMRQRGNDVLTYMWLAGFIFLFGGMTLLFQTPAKRKEDPWN
jgi:hypothetical protein